MASHDAVTGLDDLLVVEAFRDLSSR